MSQVVEIQKDFDKKDCNKKDRDNWKGLRWLKKSRDNWKRKSWSKMIVIIEKDCDNWKGLG